MTNVLILDDNPFVCKAIQKQVLALGVSEAITSHSAREALSLLTNDKVRVDLVICDLRLPETDGIEFLKELHKINKEVAVAILSGQDESILSAAAKVAEQYGFNVVGYVAKPASPEDLRGLLRRLEFDSDSVLAFSAIEVSDDQIRQGIAQREFTCSYQPLVEIASGVPVGVEALARWTMEDGNTVPPNVFIPKAEQSEIISSLTDLLFERAIDDYAHFRSSGIKPYLAFNLSNRVLGEQGLPAALAQACANGDIPPEKIVLEITESSLQDDQTTLLEVATRFRLKHFRLAIDDFGTGFSNLARLARLPFSELKIDCSFLWDARENPKSAEILDSTCQMAKALGLKTVAEGIEDERDLEFVKKVGVEIGQGFYFSKPLARDDLINWWKVA